MEQKKPGWLCRPDGRSPNLSAEWFWLFLSPSNLLMEVRRGLPEFTAASASSE